MIQVKEIAIKRLEGCTLFGRVGEAFTVKSWKEADENLFLLSSTAPKDGTYDKMRFKITFENGVIYKGRYDLKHHQVEMPSLFNHVKDFVLYHAGLSKPSWLSQEKYEISLSGVDKNEYKEFARLYLGLEV